VVAESRQKEEEVVTGSAKGGLERIEASAAVKRMLGKRLMCGEAGRWTAKDCKGIGKSRSRERG
jgi:hypothetical protein